MLFEMKSRSKKDKAKTVFITGTDTGVGKTVLTALLLAYLRRQGRIVWAIKPFCTGRRGDVRLLHRLQDGELTLAEINPFHFSEPVAPLVAMRRSGCKVSLSAVLRHIHGEDARRGLARGWVADAPQSGKVVLGAPLFIGLGKGN
ncbi:MAG: dethiobiotin synthase, partial [Candidatus Omnitrophica bacterium]|nr:dethiobiotin synthase [Candidatus Omnitrophota bacterium]